MKPKHPMQPVVMTKTGVVRFHRNRIIEWLWETNRIDLNEIAAMCHEIGATKDDQMQFAQLLGYSIGGYGDLSYVSDNSYKEANERLEKLLLKAGKI